MINQILEKIHYDQWSWLVPWLAVLSIVTFFGSIAGGWWVLVNLPEDYLTRSGPTSLVHSNSKVGNFLLHLVKNLFGLVFLLVGVIMIFTPGQGVLSIVVGIILIEFPGKQRLVRKVLAKPRILNAINKVRRKAGKVPLVAPQSV